MALTEKDDLTGKGLAKAITTMLDSLGLDKDNMVECGFDGAPAMAGHKTVISLCN